MAGEFSGDSADKPAESISPAPRAAGASDHAVASDASTGDEPGEMNRLSGNASPNGMARPSASGEENAGRSPRHRASLADVATKTPSKMLDQLLNYNLQEVLGKGAGSTIYRGRDKNTGRVVAVKHVVRERTKDIRFVDQMQNEYEVSKNFSHENLRRAFLFKSNRTLLMKVVEAVLVLDYVEGEPLERSLPSDLPGVLDTFTQVAKGLRAMHKLGYAHCDIKPSNILITSDGTVKVIDFGQSCKIGTVKERIQGTPDYIAPEQVDRLPIAESTDVFNLGATLYWALTGTNIPTRYHAKRKGDNSFLIDSMFKTPSDLNPEVPKVVSDVVMECVATNMKKRPQSMDEVIRKLELGHHMLLRDPALLKNQAKVESENDTRV